MKTTLNAPRAALRLLALVALLLAGLSTVVGSGGGGGGGAPPVVTPPAPAPPPVPVALGVVGTVPAAGAVDVSSSAAVAVTFSEAIGPSLGFAVEGPSGPVAGAVSVSGATATFTPSAPLVPGSDHGVAVVGVTGVTGKTLASNSHAWSFRTAVAPVPTLALSAATLNYSATQGGADPVAQTVTVNNVGQGVLTGIALGNVSYGAGAAGWLQPMALSATTAPATFTVRPVTGSLPAGTYSATIDVLSAAAPNSPSTFSVALTVTFTVVAPPPVIALTPASRAFSASLGGASPASQSIAVGNAGGGSLSGLSVGAITYSAGSAGWLQASLNSTSAPAVLTLQPLTSGLPAGNYSASVAVRSSVAGVVAQLATVSLTVAPGLPPSICISPTPIAFSATQGGANPAGRTFTIDNCGGGALTGLSVSVVYGQNPAWLQAPTLNRTSAPATLSLQALTGGLAAGTYFAAVQVASPGAAGLSVIATFNVGLPAPSIALTPAARSFTATQGGASPASQSVTVSNSGGGTLSGLSVGTVSYGAGASGWLPTPTLNTSTAPATLSLQPQTGSLAAGTYTASVPVQSAAAGNSPQLLSVTFTVAVPPGAIGLSASALSYSATQGGANPLAQTVAISNSGSGTLGGLSVGTIAYGAGASGWLQAPTLSATSAPATLTLQPLVGALAAGTYTATVPLLSLSASNSPRNVSVTLTVYSQGQQVVISGLADYESVPNDTATNGRLNYAGASFKPIRGASVQLLAAGSGAVLASAVTSATGTYSLAIPVAQPVVVSVRAELKRVATTGGQWDFTVRDNTAGDSLYLLESAAFTPAAGASTRNLRAASGWGGASYTAPRAAGPFAILDVAYLAVQKVLSVAPNTVLPALRFFWSTNNIDVPGDPAVGEVGCTCYRSVANFIFLSGRQDVDTDEYDSHVVAHEIGHYLEFALSRLDNFGGAHAIGERVDMRVAFSEGWSTAWAGMLLGTPALSDSMDVGQASGSIILDVSQAPTLNRGWFNEASVGHVLWSLHQDGTIGFAPIFNTLTGPLKTSSALIGIHNFATALKAAVPARAAAIDALLAGQLITAQDALGSGETNDGGVALALPIYKTHSAALGVPQNYCVTDVAQTAFTGEFNKLGMWAYVRITLASAGSRTLTLSSTNGAAPTDPNVVLIRSDGSSAAYIDVQANVQTLTTTLPAGTHLLLFHDYNLSSNPATAAAQQGTRCFNLVVQ